MSSPPPVFETFAVELRRAAEQAARRRSVRRRRVRAAVSAATVSAVALALVLRPSQDPASASQLAAAALDIERGAVTLVYEQTTRDVGGLPARQRVTLTRTTDAVKTVVADGRGTRIWVVDTHRWRMYDSSKAVLTEFRWSRPRPVDVSAEELDPFQRVRRLFADPATRVLRRSVGGRRQFEWRKPGSVTHLTTSAGDGEPITLDVTETKRRTFMRLTDYRRLTETAARSAVGFKPPTGTRVTVVPASPGAPGSPRRR